MVGWRDGDRSADPSRHEGWMSEPASALATAGFLALAFVVFTLLAMEPLVGLDAYFNLDPPPAGWVPVLQLLDRVGQRAICLPILAVVALLCCRRQQSWRPAFIAAGSVFTLNLLVLILKVGLGRGQPQLADPTFFIGGAAYPSGHTANIVLMYGLMAYLAGRYLDVRRGTRIALWSGVAALSVLMVAVSMTLNWHWFADLIAGLIIGGVVLELTVAADAALPRDAFEHGWRESLRRLRTRVRDTVPRLRSRTGTP
jgi:membrane-associated phospholipid phosphatase